MAALLPEHDPSRELREHLAEHGWRAVLRTLCARHGLDAGALAPFASGSDVVWGAGEAVIKLTAPHRAPQVEDEARWLERVEGRLSVTTPRVLARGELEGWPYLILTRVPGLATSAAWPRLDRDERLRLAGALGTLVRELHELPLEAGEEPGGAADRWPEFWRACLEDVPRRHARPDAPAELLEELPSFLEAVGPLPCADRVPLHTEVLDEHVLLAERGGRLEPSALIDFADARVGPAAYELPAVVEFVLRGEPRLLPRFLEAAGRGDVGPEDAERLLAWSLCHRFGSLARVARALLPARPATLGEAARLLYRWS